jgi:hypothetical protein
LVVGGDGDVPILNAIAFALAFGAADVVVYALPVSRYGWSIGNLLTRRRLVDRVTGMPLPFRTAIKRYFARRLGALRIRHELNPTGRRSNTCLSTADQLSGSVVIRESELGPPRRVRHR